MSKQKLPSKQKVKEIRIKPKPFDKKYHRAFDSLGKDVSHDFLTQMGFTDIDFNHKEKGNRKPTENYDIVAQTPNGQTYKIDVEVRGKNSWQDGSKPMRFSKLSLPARKFNSNYDYVKFLIVVSFDLKGIYTVNKEKVQKLLNENKVKVINKTVKNHSEKDSFIEIDFSEDCIKRYYMDNGKWKKI